MSDVIVLNGIAWDKENLVIDGQTVFNHIESKIIAYQLGKRLPTKNELDELKILPHSWDKNKKGMWFAEKEEDLRTDMSLFLEFAGYYYDKNYVGSYGCHWTASPINVASFPYRLYFYNPDCNMLSTNNGYLGTIRCVSDINKSEVMKTNQEIEFKIPEGYVIDNSKSTESKIVCKPIEIKYPKLWEDAFWTKPISGFDIRLYNTEMRSATGREKSLFKTKKQAASALAHAQLTQLMALPCYNGDWMPNWDDPNQKKYCITSMRYDIVKLDYSGYFSFLAFKSKKIRDIFFNNHMDLIRQFYQS